MEKSFELKFHGTCSACQNQVNPSDSNLQELLLFCSEDILMVECQNCTKPVNVCIMVRQQNSNRLYELLSLERLVKIMSSIYHSKKFDLTEQDLYQFDQHAFFCTLFYFGSFENALIQLTQFIQFQQNQPREKFDAQISKTSFLKCSGDGQFLEKLKKSYEDTMVLENF